MSTYASSVSSFATRMATPRRSYASVVAAGLGVTVANPALCFEERSFSMAELNTGSIELPRWHAHVDDPVAPNTTVFLRSTLLAELNAGSERVSRPSDSERRAAMPLEARNVSETSTRPGRHCISMLRTHPRRTHSPSMALPADPQPVTSCFWGRIPAPPHGYTHADEAHDSPPYHSATPSLPYRERPWKDFGLLYWPYGPLEGSASPFPSPPPVVRRQKPRRRKYYGPFEACSRADVLPEFAEDSDEEDDRAGGKELREEDESSDGWSLQAMRHRMMRVREPDAGLRSRRACGDSQPPFRCGGDGIESGEAKRDGRGDWMT
ncbi:hypothetical protein B0H14DRAFT_2604618 [Mycena olivaceomarginata]|nr:hypothetical protein B0H14DRAFT_2604618 [Mycena olivaceomarginata]